MKSIKYANFSLKFNNKDVNNVNMKLYYKKNLSKEINMGKLDEVYGVKIGYTEEFFVVKYFDNGENPTYKLDVFNSQSGEYIESKEFDKEKRGEFMMNLEYDKLVDCALEC